MNKGCICQECNKEYFIDFIVDDYLWELIKPKNKDTGAGLLCGTCIIKKLETLKSTSYNIQEI